MSCDSAVWCERASATMCWTPLDMDDVTCQPDRGRNYPTGWMKPRCSTYPPTIRRDKLGLSIQRFCYLRREFGRVLRFLFVDLFVIFLWHGFLLLQLACFMVYSAENSLETVFSTENSVARTELFSHFDIDWRIVDCGLRGENKVLCLIVSSIPVVKQLNLGVTKV